MMLAGKNAVIYGAGGSIGGAVAKAFAAEGARVFLTGPHRASLQSVADEIMAKGGRAELAEVDALDESAVNAHLETLLRQAGQVNVSFNAVGLKDTQNIALTDMLLDDFIRPVEIAMRTQFITATAAARAMIKQKSGVILSITATPGGIGYPQVGGFGPACCAIESFSRDMAAEIGPYGVRAVNIRSGGSPDTRVFREALEAEAEITQSFLKKLEGDTMLKQLPMMEDIANAAVFLASEKARKITGVTIDITCGSTTGLNGPLPGIPF